MGIVEKAIRASTFGLFDKPKTPGQTAQEKELERRQRTELDELTREENERLKAIKRQSRGRRTLLGSFSSAGTGTKLGGGGVRGGGGVARGDGGPAGSGGIAGRRSGGSILGSGGRQLF